MTTDLFRFRDPLTFDQISAAQLDGQDEGVWIAPPGTLTCRLRVPPTFHDFPSGESIFTDLSTRPPVIYPPVFALARNNVTLAGYRTMLGQDGTFCMDEAYLDQAAQEAALNRLSALDEFNNEATGLTLINDNREFSFSHHDRPVIEHKGTAILLCSTEPSNYGSFLFRILPKLKTMQEAGLDGPIIVPVYTDSTRALLSLSGIDGSRIVPHYANALYKIDRAIMLSLRNNQAYLDESSIDFYTNLRARHGEDPRGRKLYITRRNLGNASLAAGARVMQNEGELIQALESHGFEIVEPSRLSALEQIRLFSSANMIVGASGSAMFNAVFCHPGTKLVDIESEPHWIHAHMCLFGSLGLNYGIFEGETYDRDFGAAHKPFSIDVESLVARVLEFDRTSQ
ncbi:glycosyltransferase 61 family protein [Burkholderia sp. SIMBA_043]|uniref:glycosyltransferase family 61 protein n=3 Tax=Bacteria TaxID=2 RepID=UPI00130E666F|nr:glycosyltransferase 61 family protein [Burkholderia vietnamiensis]MBH9648401.1 glycosyltransferase family 61 protein [Burkholderia vietnamiensis]MDN8043674.1 glycosyltransferase 61 family protein [Burkholderia vietnamiensis]UBI26641.1 glycosyltransferase family 61 protein [Burkholderia vietnamiensis]HDR9135125.1 glycosyltransferase family 61 protein [Burkholderia vietnamiensis]